MALIDKLFTNEVASWTFSAAMWFWAKGDFTRAQVITGLGLETSDEAQLDQLKTNYQALTSEEQKAFLSDLLAASILASEGKINKTQFQNLLNL
ncbi:MAG: hypothetical protein ACXAC5_02815 [Promethearchaeota archaeon]|jgi:hypothetical protein